MAQDGQPISVPINMRDHYQDAAEAAKIRFFIPDTPYLLADPEPAKPGLIRRLFGRGNGPG